MRLSGRKTSRGQRRHKRSFVRVCACSCIAEEGTHSLAQCIINILVLHYKHKVNTVWSALKMTSLTNDPCAESANTQFESKHKGTETQREAALLLSGPGSLCASSPLLLY